MAGLMHLIYTLYLCMYECIKFYVDMYVFLYVCVYYICMNASCEAVLSDHLIISSYRRTCIRFTVTDRNRTTETANYSSSRTTLTCKLDPRMHT